MKRKVFLCEDIHQDAYMLLSKHFEIMSDINDIDQVEAIITRNIQVDQTLIEKCKQLKLVAIHGTGCDSVDIKCLKERHITVFNVPGQNALSVSELVVSLMLNLSRKVYLADRLLQDHQLVETGSKLLEGIEISGKTMGFIGYGNVARKTAQILKNGFDMNIIAYSPSLTKEKAQNLCVERCDCIEEVFEKADFVSIHCLLNDKTRGMIDLDVLKHAKKGSFLINTARGAIIHEDDLYIALKEGILQGAACDVFVSEPPTLDNPLLTLDYFIATPHIGATTEEALKRVGMKVVENIIDYFDGKNIAHQL